jgi:hypothetical protein
MKLWVFLILAVVAGACSKKETIVTPAVAQHPLTASDIDADPVAVLPSGFIGLLRAEIPAVTKSSLGPMVLALANKLAPLPPTSGFVPERDVDRLVLGLYSMQGADVAGLAMGRFNPEGIKNAANATPTTAQGTLVQSPYAGYLLYTVHNVGFCVLSSRTLLIGNETGIRRSLDRIHDGRAVHQMPDWTSTLLDPARAPIAFGANLKSSAVPAGLSQQVPFLADLNALRVLGNFEPPGVNLAGSLGYATPERAEQAAGEMLASRDRLASMGWLMAVMGVSQPIQRLEAKATDREVSFVAALDGAALAKVLSLLTPAIASAAASPGSY